MKLDLMLPVRWRKLTREMDLIAGQVQIHKVRRHLVGVVKTDEQIYVFDGRCPHAGRSLEGCQVTAPGIIKCPAHGFRLSLSPQPCSVHAIPLITWTCRVRDGIVEVDRNALRRKRPPDGWSRTDSRNPVESLSARGPRDRGMPRRRRPAKRP